MKHVAEWPEYMISRDGALYRVITRGGNIQEPSPVRPWKSLAGYNQAYLTRKGVKKVVSIHRVVAQTYLPNPDNLPQVNHKDGDKDNNTVDNLEWCSAGANMKNAKDRGKFNHSGDMKLLDSQVRDLRDRRAAGTTIAQLAKDFGVSLRYVQQLVNYEFRKDV